MKTSTFIKLFAWIIATIVITTLSINLINQSDTFLNIIGVCIVPVYAFISVQTKCLTNIKITKK